MSRHPIPTWYFVLAVVRDGDRFLLVEETKHGQTWYVPAGRVEPGETLLEGLVREVWEEAQVEIEVEGILRFQHTPKTSGSRVRVLFLARPRHRATVKTVPDEHSLRSAWVTREEAVELRLRGLEVLEMIDHVLEGGVIAPLSILGSE